MKPNNTELLYGCVARELHKEAADDSLRYPHYHIATVSSKKHMWLPIAKHSRDHYGINLNASKKLSRAYGEQFAYIREASAKKPLSEIDQTPYFSPTHPQGDALREILERYQRAALSHMVLDWEQVPRQTSRALGLTRTAC